MLKIGLAGSWCNDCNMTKVYFESRNFHNKLHWEEVKIPGREVRYSVRYHAYGEKSSLMTGCRNISETSCDLSSVIMTDVRSKYFVKIMDNELCLGQFTHFVPLERTSLEAPALSVMATRSSFTVTLTTPMGPQNRSIKEISCWERCQDSGISSVKYIVHLTHPESEAGKVFHNTSGLITVSHLEVNTEYCGIALYELTHPSIKRQSENTTFCVTLPATYKPWIVVFVMSLIVILFLMITLALILCQQYVTKKRNLPKALQFISVDTIPNFNPEPKLEITTLMLCTESRKTVKPELTILNLLKQSTAVSMTGYPVPNYHNQDWHCHSYTNQQAAPVSDKSAESCTSYSMVVGVKIPQEQEELSSCATDSGLGDSISPGLSSCTEEDLFPVMLNTDPEEDLGMIEPVSTSELLVLPVSRLNDGTLEFTGLAPQRLVPNVIHSSEMMSLGVRSPPEERTLLLTDIYSTEESDCTDNESSPNYSKVYLPNRVPQSCSELPFTETKGLLSNFTSHYRDNWVAGILPDPLANDMNGIVRDTLLHETEKDADESPSVIEANFLHGWMVQIQG
ncbi:interferon lambda receptor 1 precursor [Silurus meridionalis]|nr:interferon lambda receptor 1 precursor [Silurus meridionalis]